MPDQPTHMVSMTSGGIVKLSDGSLWRVAPDHLPRTLDWATGTPLNVEPQPEHERYTHRLVDPATGISVSAIASQDLEHPWPRLQPKA